MQHSSAAVHQGLGVTICQPPAPRPQQLCKVTAVSLLCRQSPPPCQHIPTRWGGGDISLLSFVLCPPSLPVIYPLSCQVGHGMDSRPAMAIFELLDYIVNEVCALGLQALSSVDVAWGEDAVGWAPGGPTQ